MPGAMTSLRAVILMICNGLCGENDARCPQIQIIQTLKINTFQEVTSNS